MADTYMMLHQSEASCFWYLVQVIRFICQWQWRFD